MSNYMDTAINVHGIGFLISTIHNFDSFGAVCGSRENRFSLLSNSGLY